MCKLLFLFICSYPDYCTIVFIVRACAYEALTCSAIHKKPVCNKCDARTNCTKCCLCQPHTRGRPRKTMVLSRSEPQRLNPERQAWVHPDQDDAVDSEVIAVEDDDPIEHASQAHILKVLELMGCNEGYESAVRQLPQIDVRHEVQCASVPSEVDVAAMNRVENVFRRGLKAWALMLLLNLRIKGDLKMAFSIQSITTTIEELEDCENQVASCVPSSSISLEVLNSIPNTIRDMLWHEKCYTSIPARKLLVPFADIPHAYIASLLNISNKYAGCLAFQAKVDRLYITHGVSLQEYSQTQSHVPRDSVHFAVDFIYSDDNVGRLAWQAKKRTPNRDPRWKGLDHVFALRSLVLKHNVATLYRGYVVKQKEVMPRRPPIGQSIFYSLVRHITGVESSKRPVLE